MDEHKFFLSIERKYNGQKITCPCLTKYFSTPNLDCSFCCSLCMINSGPCDFINISLYGCSVAKSRP